MYTGEMVSVSEQQLIDCDHAKPFEDLGCEGGDFTGEDVICTALCSLCVMLCGIAVARPFQPFGASMRQHDVLY